MPTKTDDYARPATPPASQSWSTVREAAKDCTACHLYKNATQTVFGEGPKKAPIMLIGEQPGDYEDVAGKPFVGPAGKIMNRALEEAGIDRKEVYVTNAVKHFKWEPRGKRRIHQKPNSREVAACKPWLESQFRLEPRLTRRHFARVRFLMNTPFAARLPFEMLHRVGDINLFAIDSRFLERAVHDFSGRTNERFPGNIFVIPRLLANEHDRRFLWTFAKYRLGGVLV